jgi:hypothetical protein
MREGLIRGAQWRAGAYTDGYLYAALRRDSPRHEIAAAASVLRKPRAGAAAGAWGAQRRPQVSRLSNALRALSVRILLAEADRT